MEKLDIKDFLKFNFLSSIELSKDSKNLLFVKIHQDYEKNNYISDVFIYNIEKNKIYKLTSVKDASLVSWLNDDTVIFKSSLRDEELKRKKDEEFIDYSLIYSININGGEAESLFNIELEVIDLYSIDEKSTIRKSHENPILKQIYAEYLEAPGSQIAHKLLHTHYVKRPKYNITK